MGRAGQGGVCCQGAGRSGGVGCQAGVVTGSAASCSDVRARMSLVSVETNFTFDKQPNCEIFPSPRTESTGALVSPASTRRVRAWKFHMCVLAVNLHACAWSVLGNSTMKQNGIDAAISLALPWRHI